MDAYKLEYFVIWGMFFIARSFEDKEWRKSQLCYNQLLCTKISVHLSAFIYRLFHEDFFLIVRINSVDYN